MGDKRTGRGKNVKIKILTALFLVLNISSAFAKDEEVDEGLVVVDANLCQFNLKGYELSKATEEAVVFGISMILETYKDTFGFSYPDDIKVEITIFGDREEFKRYQVERISEIISDYGYYDGKHREVVVWKDKKTTSMVSTLFHEASHLILMHNVPWCPPWVNEGLAVYFGGLDVIGSDKRILLVENYHKWCKYWLKNGFPTELEKYITLSHDEWGDLRSRDSTSAYGMGYSLVYFMMSRESTQKVLKELLWEFKRQGEAADSIGTVDRCYPGGFKQLKKIWLKWIPRARPYRPLRALRKERLQPAVQFISRLRYCFQYGGFVRGGWFVG